MNSPSTFCKTYLKEVSFMNDIMQVLLELVRALYSFWEINVSLFRQSNPSIHILQRY